MVFAGTGLALALVIGGLAYAVMALKAAPVAGIPASLPAPEFPAKNEAPYSIPQILPPVLPSRPANMSEGERLAPAAQPLAAAPDPFAPRKASIVAKEQPAAIPAEKDNTCGTKIQFQSSPTAAYKKARAESKLVFILHVSGNFEDPQFT
jgi:hypothetical protein